MTPAKPSAPELCLRAQDVDTIMINGICHERSGIGVYSEQTRQLTLDGGGLRGAILVKGRQPTYLSEG